MLKLLLDAILDYQYAKLLPYTFFAFLGGAAILTFDILPAITGDIYYNIEQSSLKCRCGIGQTFQTDLSEDN